MGDDGAHHCGMVGRFIGLVVSKAMLASEWATMERSIAVWSDPAGRQGRVLPLLKENVDLPPSLRIRNWIDFREPDRFEDAFLELIGRLTDTPVRPMDRASNPPGRRGRLHSRTVTSRARAVPANRPHHGRISTACRCPRRARPRRRPRPAGRSDW